MKETATFQILYFMMVAAAAVAATEAEVPSQKSDDAIEMSDIKSMPRDLLTQDPYAPLSKQSPSSNLILNPQQQQHHHQQQHQQSLHPNFPAVTSIHPPPSPHLLGGHFNHDPNFPPQFDNLGPHPTPPDFHILPHTPHDFHNLNSPHHLPHDFRKPNGPHLFSHDFRKPNSPHHLPHDFHKPNGPLRPHADFHLDPRPPHPPSSDFPGPLNPPHSFPKFTQGFADFPKNAHSSLAKPTPLHDFTKPTHPSITNPKITHSSHTQPHSSHDTHTQKHPQSSSLGFSKPTHTSSHDTPKNAFSSTIVDFPKNSFSSAFHDAPKSSHSSIFHDVPKSSHSSTFHDTPKSSHFSTFHDIPKSSFSSSFHDTPKSSHSTSHDIPKRSHSSSFDSHKNPFTSHGISKPSHQSPKVSSSKVPHSHQQEFPKPVHQSQAFPTLVRPFHDFRPPFPPHGPIRHPGPFSKLPHVHENLLGDPHHPHANLLDAPPHTPQALPPVLHHTELSHLGPLPPHLGHSGAGKLHSGLRPVRSHHFPFYGYDLDPYFVDFPSFGFFDYDHIDSVEKKGPLPHPHPHPHPHPPPVAPHGGILFRHPLLLHQGRSLSEKQAASKEVDARPKSSLDFTTMDRPKSSLDFTTIDRPKSSLDFTTIDRPKSSLDFTTMDRPKSSLDFTTMDVRPKSSLDFTTMDRPKSSLDFIIDSMEAMKTKEKMDATMEKKSSSESPGLQDSPETKTREIKKALSRIPRSGKKNLHQPLMPSLPHIRYLGAPSY
ncbi:hypothetical protein Pmani_005359 [Petrolisthes manimaculis]|uniref:Uncharacterized protein n=1 Tax=Petrolisthes manimaculis TaxID=1843537 RepID=A0AAE1QD26_9EUCA|nr:hypothetical protein Pmani_005359 [Petrolisthes manimaculis]